MTEGNVRVDLGGGLTAYLAAADETTTELLASDERLVATVREYDIHFRTRLWSAGAPDAMPLVLFMNAYQLFLAGVRRRSAATPWRSSPCCARRWNRRPMAD